MIFYTVYRTQNLVNGKYYFGVHKTKNPYDGYLGSGKVLKAAIRKHGEQSFIKNVCFIFDNSGEAFAKEYELIETYRADPLCYNLRQGGSGGFDWINQQPNQGWRVRAANRTNSAERWKTDANYRDMIRNNFNRSGARGSSEMAKQRGLSAIGSAAARLRNIKAVERMKAQELFEQGICKAQIAALLGVAKSSVSVWVKGLSG